MTVGKRIKQARKACGFTQAQLAKASGLSTMSIRRYEADERTPTDAVLKKIADNLYITIDYLKDSFDVKEFFEAIKNSDYDAISNILDISLEEVQKTKLPSRGSIETIEAKTLEQSKQSERLYLKFEILIKGKFGLLTNEMYTLLYRLVNAFSELNTEGQEAAILRLEEMTELQKYQSCKLT